jgi:hypothetical protein
MQNDAKLNVSNHKQPEILLKVQMNRTYWCCHVLPKLLSSLSELPKLEPSGQQIDHRWPWCISPEFCSSKCGNPMEPVRSTRRYTKYLPVLSTPVLSLSFIYFLDFSTLIFAEHIWAHNKGIPLDFAGSELESPCSTISTGTSRIALSPSHKTC